MHYFGYQVLKHPFYCFGPKMMFGSVSEHFANLGLVKRCKTFVSGLNALLRGTKVVKHPFYSIGPIMMFGSVSEHFANLRHVKRCKTCVSGLNAIFWVPKL
jgi:acid stress-induced BolA-like protein IbaG/YrbA